MNKLGFVTGPLRNLAVPVGAVFLAAGLALSLSMAQSTLEYREALELRGVVTGKELVRADRETNRRTRFLARYRVDTPDGQAIEAEEDLPRESWEALAVGDEHRVQYLLSKRKLLPPAASGEFVGNIIAGVVGLVFGGIGALLLLAPVAKLVARVRLLERGVPSTATVTDVFQTSTAVNRVVLWQLRYRYRDASGAEHEAASELLMPEEAAEWQAGATGPILVDPARPESSAWVGRHAAPPDPATPGLAARTWSKAKTLMRWVVNLALFFAALFVAAVIGELVPALKELDIWMNDQRLPLVFATGGSAVLGVFLLVGAVVYLLMEGDEPMDHTDVEKHQRSMRDAEPPQRVWRMSTYRLFGSGAGASGHDEFPLTGLKRAIAGGAIWRDAVWRRRACAACGGMLMFLGIFGTLIVISPLALKLVFAVVVAYALARFAWAWTRA